MDRASYLPRTPICRQSRPVFGVHVPLLRCISGQRLKRNFMEANLFPRIGCTTGCHASTSTTVNTTGRGQDQAERGRLYVNLAKTCREKGKFSPQARQFLDENVNLEPRDPLAENCPFDR